MRRRLKAASSNWSPRPARRPRSSAAVNAEGFFLLSLSADLDEVLPRLDALGVGGQPTVAAVGPVRLAVVHDPNGVRVELMDIAARSNLAAMSGHAMSESAAVDGAERRGTGRSPSSGPDRAGSVWPSGWRSRAGATSSCSRRRTASAAPGAANTYPGAACDVPSHLYSYSFALKPDWSKTYANQPEILQYFEDCADRFGIRPHLRTHTRITVGHVGRGGARGGGSTDDERRRILRGRRARQRHRHLHDAVVPRHRGPRRPSPGRASTRRAGSTSTTWRAGGWPSSGPGPARRRSSPRWPRCAEQVDVYQRTPQWILPRSDKPFTRGGEAALRPQPACGHGSTATRSTGPSRTRLPSATRTAPPTASRPWR